MRYKTKHIAEYAALRTIAGVAGFMPYTIALVFGWCIAGIIIVFSRKRMKKFRTRIKNVFGDNYSDKEINKILWLAWRNFCFSAIELLRIPKLTPERMQKIFADGKPEDLKPYLKNGKGAIIALTHMGNWEMAGITLANMGVPLFVIMRSQKNPLIDAYLNKTREATSIDAIKMGAKTISGVIEKLKHGKVLAILPDIKAKRNPVTVDFLGGKANIARGMAFFAKSAGVPIIPVVIRREGWKKHHWKIFSEAVFPDNSLNRDEDIERMTKIIMKDFDALIRKYPDQYFWFNKKWILEETP